MGTGRSIPLAGFRRAGRARLRIHVRPVREEDYKASGAGQCFARVGQQYSGAGPYLLSVRLSNAGFGVSYSPPSRPAVSTLFGNANGATALDVVVNWSDVKLLESRCWQRRMSATRVDEHIRDPRPWLRPHSRTGPYRHPARLVNHSPISGNLISTAGTLHPVHVAAPSEIFRGCHPHRSSRAEKGEGFLR